MNDRDEGREWIKKHKERDYQETNKSIKRVRQRMDWKRHSYKERWANQERYKNMKKTESWRK